MWQGRSVRSGGCRDSDDQSRPADRGRHRQARYRRVHAVDCFIANLKTEFMPETQSATPTSELTSDLRELAADVVRRAMATGASAAEAVVQEGDEFSTVVRLGE